MTKINTQEMLVHWYNSFSRYIGMVFMSRNRTSPNGILFNGTMSFINTGEREIGITCAHVFQKFQELQQEDSNTFLGLGGTDVNPIDISSAKPIDIGDSGIDIVTLDLTDCLDISDLGKDYYQGTVWPPQKAITDDVVFYIGFPGIHRESSQRGLEARALILEDFVVSSSSRHFVIGDGGRESFKTRTDLVDRGSMGGVSGAAVFRIDTAKGKTLSCFSFAGIVYEEMPDKKNDLDKAILFCHHANLIQSDGSLIHNLA